MVSEDVNFVVAAVVNTTAVLLTVSELWVSNGRCAVRPFYKKDREIRRGANQVHMSHKFTFVPVCPQNTTLSIDKGRIMWFAAHTGQNLWDKSHASCGGVARIRSRHWRFFWQVFIVEVKLRLWV